jgi:peroxiredoxin
MALDTYRTRVFKEENWLLGGGNGPFAKEKSVVFATPLSDPAGRASAIYGVARRALRWGSWVENYPHWFVIDRRGVITYILRPTFATPTSYQDDVDSVLRELEKAH